MPANGWRKRQVMQWIPSEKKEQPEQESKLKRFVWFKTANGWRKEEFEKTLVKKVPLDTAPPEPKPHVWFDFSNCDSYSSKEEFEKTLLNNVPQREWQSLTDDEIKEIIGSYAGPIKGYTRELFDKIEAKLREKNT